jgi:hypothetical protein
MNESPDHYFARSDQPSLTPEERAAGRMALQARMALSLTAEEKTDIRRALQHVVYADPAPAPAWSLFRLPARLPALAFAVVLLLGASGGGLAYAAESALPGDALYGVKIYVNEAIRGSFQLTPEDRASWALRRFERRLDELHRLEARGRAQEEIDVAMGEHIERAAMEVEAGVEALPAAAAERAALRTAVNAAIGTDQDDLRRASRINRVLKALKERADQFDAPAQGAAAGTVDAAVKQGPLRVNVGGTASVSVGADASSAARSSARASRDRSSERAASRAASSAPAEPSSSEPAIPPSPLPLPGAATDVDVDLEGTVDGTVDGLL